MRPYIPILILLALFSSCKKNPTGPEMDLTPQSLSGGPFHGTWLSLTSQADSLKIGFDSTSMTFIDQYGYDFGIRREFPGSFSRTASVLYLNYDYGRSEAYSYQISGNTLTLGNNQTFVRINPGSSKYGWSIKPGVTSEFIVFDLPGVYVHSLAFCDSGTIAFAYLSPHVNEYLPHLITFDIQGATVLEPAPKVRALDARGRYLWIATDSTVIKRTIADTTVLFSFNYRGTLPSESYVKGIAVDSQYCFLMTDAPGLDQGRLLKFTLDGAQVSITQTSGVLVDLCFVGNRLYCSLGDETFVELNASTGWANLNYNVWSRPFGNNIDGIAFNGTTLQLASLDSLGNLRISNLYVP